MMKILDKTSLNGRLEIYKAFADGSKELVWEEDNLIVKAAKQFLLSGIYAPGVVSDPITSLKVGTGGNIDPEGLYPKPEDPLQTDLITPALTISTIYVTDVPNVKVTFLADVDQSQCNGSLLTEAGLFKVSGAIFNVKNHPGIPKTSDFSIHYAWTIKIL
jgi:PhoPQ-activated pathogenicity-related protein